MIIYSKSFTDATKVREAYAGIGAGRFCLALTTEQRIVGVLYCQVAIIV